MSFREVNDDNMVFKNISAEFLEDTVILVSTYTYFESVLGGTGHNVNLLKPFSTNLIDFSAGRKATLVQAYDQVPAGTGRDAATKDTAGALASVPG